MGKMKDLTGQKFNMLTVIDCAGKLDGKCYYWNCICDCGNKTTVIGTALRRGTTKSCGCLKSIGIRKYNQE